MSGIITWTHTDESPALSSISLLSIVEHFLAAADVKIQELDISFAGRILQQFPEYLTSEQQSDDAMVTLKALVERADAAIIKLPNASATDNQLKDAIRELQKKGFALPDYPENPRDAKDIDIKARYDSLTGSVVNPVLRQGNAVRSIPLAVKEAARLNPHALGVWKADSRTRIATMQEDDFFHTERSETIADEQTGKVVIRFRGKDGATSVLKSDINLKSGDIIDTAVMRKAALQDFLHNAIETSKNDGLLLSLHLKATMMKKTDGNIFGEALKIYFQAVFDSHGKTLEKLGFEAKNGLDDLLARIETLPEKEAKQIKATIHQCLDTGASLAMVNLREGSNHLSSPNNVIVDVSMANLARWGGEMQDKNGQYRDTLAVIPDSTYARMHQSGIDFLKKNGAPDVRTLGSVTTVRLQAEGAEEYGSKNTTFVAPADGWIEVVAPDGQIAGEQKVCKGDLYRFCRTSEKAIENWAKLASDEARKRNVPAIVWLDSARPHDREIISALQRFLPKEQGHRNISIMRPEIAMTETLQRSYNGQDSVCVTGNLIGDHITDYFPILEIGSSAKMLSVINLLEGGLVAETGSGGTAPDLLAMIEEKNHFLWDDTGTALALAESLRHLSEQCKNVKAAVVADALESATGRYIQDKRSPTPDGYDTRESHFYLAKYWAEALEAQNSDCALQNQFSKLAAKLNDLEPNFLALMQTEKGQKKNLSGRYYLQSDYIIDLMRPSADFDL